MFIMVVSDKQLRFAPMESPASRLATCAAWLSASGAVARAVDAGPGMPA